MVDDSCHLSFNTSQAKRVTKNLTTDITITSKVLINKPKRKYVAISFKCNVLTVLSLVTFPVFGLPGLTWETNRRNISPCVCV